MDWDNKPHPELYFPADRNYRGYNYSVFTNKKSKEVPMEWIIDNWTTLACPPKVVPIVKLVVVQTKRNRAYDTQTVHA